MGCGYAGCVYGCVYAMAGCGGAAAGGPPNLIIELTWSALRSATEVLNEIWLGSITAGAATGTGGGNATGIGAGGGE